MPDKNRIIIVLGSNEGAERNMDLACRKLEELFPVQWSEAVYTQPLRCAVRKPFLNRVGLSFTSWGIKELRECFKRIERELGRTAESKQIGIIPMDIDLIQWNDSLLKPDDWTRDYVQDGLRQLELANKHIGRIKELNERIHRIVVRENRLNAEIDKIIAKLEEDEV